jgi:hypothetical protein
VTSGGSGGKCVKHLGNSCSGNTQLHAYDGGFGYDGAGSNHYYGSGGGSGYFGGGGGSITYCKVGSGSGGSSYISGYQGFHTFTLENNMLKDTNSERHGSGLIFDRIQVKNGTETRYVGNGKIIITKITAMGYISCNNQLYDYSRIVYASFLVLIC